MLQLQMNRVMATVDNIEVLHTILIGKLPKLVRTAGNAPAPLENQTVFHTTGKW